jgi:hypothetical protein
MLGALSTHNDRNQPNTFSYASLERIMFLLAQVWAEAKLIHEDS